MTVGLYAMAPSRVAIAVQHLHNNVRKGALINYVVPAGSKNMAPIAYELSCEIDQTSHTIHYDDLTTPDPKLLDMVAGNESSILIITVRADASQLVMLRLFEALRGDRLRAQHSVVFISEETNEKPHGYFNRAFTGHMVNYSYQPEETE